MIDSATPPESWAVARKSDGRVLTLVMSDEFEVAGRQFGKGKDKLFEAIEKPDNTNEAIQFCKFFESILFLHLLKPDHLFLRPALRQTTRAPSTSQPLMVA